ncbi:MAG: response regulator [Acidimicrobiia bacterium]|nr:response regulator [Acidimicrobiia bacterium]
MAEQRVLVVANETLGGRELLLMIEHLNKPRGLSSFHLVVPATHSDNFAARPLVDERGRVVMDQAGLDEAEQRLQAGIKLIEGLGAEVTGEIGPPDPLVAVKNVVELERRRREHDLTAAERAGTVSFPFAEILVSTMPHRTSRWLRMDLPHRLARAVDIPVRHVECTPNEDLVAAVEISRERRNAVSTMPQPVDDPGLTEPLVIPDEPVRVLLVEDSSTDVELARLALDRGRIPTDVVTAGNGAEALDTLSDLDPAPDLVLLDLKMPTMDGHEFLEHLNERTDVPAMPVVIVTTSDREEDRERAHHLGAHAYIVKDANFVLFQEMLEGVMAEFVRDGFGR